MKSGKPTKDIINNPIDKYIEFRKRLDDFGFMASFPEFKETVDFLISELKSDYVKKVLEENKILYYELSEVETFLGHLNFDFNIDDNISYPYATPHNGPYPYRPTIDAIEQAIRFFDKINRVDPDNKALKLYHFDRYCYHRHSVISDDNIILFPTISELGLEDFIRTRSVPIEFVGVISRTMRVDGHQQSPLDFWYHDFNHARRLYAYIKNKLIEKGLKTNAQHLEYFKSVDYFLHNTIIPKFFATDMISNEDEMAIRKMASIIIFEIVHETAVTLDKESIIQDILRASGPQPFEYMYDSEYEGEEDKRTPTGNIESGIQNRKHRLGEKINVRYFLDPGSIGLLANVFSKLNHYYYDDEDFINENMLLAKYRTPEFIVKTAKYILEVLEYENIPTEKYLMELVLDGKNTKEKSYLKPINELDEVKQFATNPLRSAEAIKMIREKYADIYTIFGYSTLGYEDVETFNRTVREKLSALDNKKYVINIGVTEEGVGAAYVIAKELGFKTIGVVSTQALSYSGKFSEYVDEIYIINDHYWGGFLPGTTELTETTKTFLGVSDFILSLGGGENTYVTLVNAKNNNIKIEYMPFEMNHEKAIKNSGKDIKSFIGLAKNINIDPIS